MLPLHYLYGSIISTKIFSVGGFVKIVIIWIFLMDKLMPNKNEDCTLGSQLHGYDLGIKWCILN